MLGLTFNVRIYWKFISERARSRARQPFPLRPNRACTVPPRRSHLTNKETSRTYTLDTSRTTKRNSSSVSQPKAKHFSSIKRWLVAILAKRLDVCAPFLRENKARWRGIKIDFPPISSKMFARIMGKAKGKTRNKRVEGREGWRSSSGIQKRYIKAAGWAEWLARESCIYFAC